MPADRVLRSRDLIGRPVRDRAGNRLGRIADLILDSGGGDSGGGPGSGAVAPNRVVAALVTDGPWGRLLGYVSPDDNGPWILNALARRIIHGHVRMYRWDEIALDADS